MNCCKSARCTAASSVWGGPRACPSRPRSALRLLLEKQQLSLHVLATMNASLAQHGLMQKTGTVVDATIIAAPCSTKDARGERDPEMRQAKRATSGTSA